MKKRMFTVSLVSALALLVLAGGYSLLVDGTATVDGSPITVAPTKAILHRPAAGPDSRRAGSDCVNV